MTEVLFSTAADNDIAELKTYISVELSAPEAASNMVKGIFDTVTHLRDHPDLGKLISSPKNTMNYRYIVYKNYMVFYRHSDKVYIDRVLYGRSDYMNILFND